MTEHDVVESVDEAHDIKADMPDAVRVIKDATASIEHQVEVIETLATSIDPLRASVDRLTDTMQEPWRCRPNRSASTKRTASSASSVDTTTTISQGKRANLRPNEFVTGARCDPARVSVFLCRRG